MKFKDVVLSEASTEAKVAALALLLDKELIRLAETVLNVQKLQGPQGEQGLQGPKGEQGERGFDGANGKDGSDGKDGKDGEEGKQGVGVADAKIDFDGSLVITLTNGREINAGDVVPMDAAEKIRVIGNGGGTSQYVLDAIEAINAVIATYGTIATQDANAVAITGGSINGTTVGATTAAAGAFTTLIGGADQVNYGQLTGGATTKAVEFKSLGSDTNVALAIRTQGTGAIDLAAGSRGVNISNGGTVTAITRTGFGTGYTSIPTVAVSAPTTAGGVQATLNVFMSSNSATIVSGGTGYKAGDVLTVVGGTGTAVQITVTTVSAGVITVVPAPTVVGYYSVLPTNPVSVTGGTGSGATFNLSYYFGGATVNNAGSGYVEQPTVSFSGGGGSGAAAYATVGSGVTVKSIGSTMSFSTPSGEVFRTTDVGATNTTYWNAIGGGSGNQPILRAQTTTNAWLQTSGGGSLVFGTNSGIVQAIVAHTASAVNYVQVTGATTGNLVKISAQGSDANVGIELVAKGAPTGPGFRIANTNGVCAAVQMSVSNPANYPYLQPAASGSSPSFSANGSDTNIDLTLTPKGTGNVRFGTLTASADAAITGYITIKDSGGTVRKLAVIA